MPKLYRILWSLAILFIVISTIVFSFGVILVGAVLVGLYGVYQHYFPKKRSAKYRTRPKEYTMDEVIDIKAEVIDIKAEVIDCKIQPGKPK